MKYATLLLLMLAIPLAVLGQQATPEISISANGERDLHLYPGWPLIVHLTIMNSSRHDKTTATPLVIAPNGAIWTSAISFTAVSSTGQPTHWPLTLAGVASTPGLTLARRSYVQATWQMSAIGVSSLPLGDYQLTATVQVSNSSGWNGLAQSQPISITIKPEPPLSSDEQSRKALLLAEYALNADDIHAAVTTTQQLRQAQPNNPSAAIASANVLAIAGYPALALLQGSAALNTYYQFNATPSEAPSDLLTVYQELLTSMATADAPALTSTFGPHATITFSPGSQSVPLNATVTAASGPVSGGTVTFTVAGVAGSATSGPVTGGSASASFSVPGGTPFGVHPLTAAYSGTAAFSGSSDSSGSLSIEKATPKITWSNPAPVRAGAILGSAQLNATASVPGSFAYSPPGGTVLAANPALTLSVTFFPADSLDYNSAASSVSIRVVAPVVGDLNGDGVVSCTDMTIVKMSFGKKEGQAGFDPRADVNGDGVVNIIDLSTVAKLLPGGTACQ
jgi:dockerin type I repeat protein/Big-like domain-containing protein